MKTGFIEFVVVLVGAFSGFADEPFKITSKRPDDHIEVKLEDDKTIFVVHSPFGISHLTIERTTEKWPDKVVIQLALKGLERLRISTDALKLEASVSSHDGSIQLWQGGKVDSPLDSKSPYWMEIKILDHEHKPTKSIPLQDGVFDLQLPNCFLEGNPRSFKLEWIDFHRN